MALKLKREVVVRSKFLTRKNSLTNEIISVIAPNGLQVGLSGSNSVSAEFNSYGTSKFYEGLSGSLTQLTDGTSYLVAGSNITVASASNGSVTISSTGGGSGSPGGSDTHVQFNDGGSFGGDAGFTYNKTTDTVSVAGAVTASLGLSGSLTRLVDGTSYLVAGSNMTVTSASNGQVTLAAASGGSTSPGGLDTQIQYNDGGSFGGVASMTFDDSSGHLTIIDDKKLQFGTGNDASIEYDEDGNDVLLINGAATKFTVAGVEIENASGSGASALTIDNDDTDRFALDIDAANINQDVINVAADALTTAFVMDVTADALTTGGILNLVSDSSDTSARNLVTVHNDNTNSVLTNLALFKNDSAGTVNSTALVTIESTVGERNPYLLLKQSSADTNRPPTLQFKRADTTAEADDMSIGEMSWHAADDGNNDTRYIAIQGKASDVTGGSESGKLEFDLMNGGSGNVEFLSLGGADANAGDNAAVVINDSGANIDFRVESDNHDHFLAIDASANKMIIGYSGAMPATTSLLEIHNDDADETLTITHSVQAGQALDIVDSSEQGESIKVTANSLTTGGMLNLTSNASSTSNRTLVTVKNDNTAATGVQMVHFLNDAIGGAGDPILLVESTAAETEALVELRNSNAATDKPPILKFNRSDTSAEASGMDLGSIVFQGADDANNETVYATILVEAKDVNNGNESGEVFFKALSDGTELTFLSYHGTGGADGEVVINENSSANVNFRVESDGEDNAIFLDSSTNKLSINKGETAFTTEIHSTNDVAISVDATGVVLNEDGHATNDFRVESDNNTHMLHVDAGDDTASAGGIDATNHKDGFAVFNDFQGTAFESKLADGQFGSGEVLRISTGTSTLTSGQIYYLRTAGNWVAADADGTSEAQSNLLGVGLGGSEQTVGVLLKGFIRIPSTEILNTPTNCPGLPIYLSTTAGHFDFTAPSSSGDVVRIVGYAIDQDSSDVLVYFSPDSTFVEIA
ncbi:MAG: hypothetical protein CMA72_09475 [Euryarchaeota archaeon]|nr:hypothetical protein [Euryarchaeota archaeon]